MDLDSWVTEIRSALREEGWKLIVYNYKPTINGDALGCCIDESKKLYVCGAKRYQKREVAYILFHEYCHFLQARDWPFRKRLKVTLAYETYYRLSTGRLKPSKRYDARLKLIIDSEYEAELYAISKLTELGYSTKGMLAMAQAYLFLVKYTFQTGEACPHQRQRISTLMRLPDRRIPCSLKYAPLEQEAIELLRKKPKG
jgi:hypothetical protein